MASWDHEDLKSTNYKDYNTLKEVADRCDRCGPSDSGAYAQEQLKPFTFVIPNYKYGEGKYLEEIKNYIDNTYSAHYRAEENELQCIDVWFALGTALTSCRDVVMKYLWRVGKKGNKEEFRKDVMKAIHYCFFILHALDKKELD